MTGPVLALDVAENLLLADELATLFTDPPLVLEPADLTYPDNSIGDADVRAAIATLWNETCGLSGPFRLAADHVVCTPGASAALYFHGVVRLQPGQSVIIPSPYWNNFERVYKRIEAPLVRMPVNETAASQVDLDTLKHLHGQLQAEGRPPGLLLLTNPHNPLGIVESREQLATILDWAIASTDMDVVVDEIYAHTLYGSSPFVSVMQLEQSLAHPERIHSVWGFAKDFGLSGWMAGVLFTRSARLVKTISGGYARFSPFDKLKSRVMRRLLLEGVGGKSARELLQLFDNRLRTLRDAVADRLRAHGIPFREQAEGAPFFWLDVRAWLPDSVNGIEAEAALQKMIAEQARVSLVKGQALYKDEPGYLRLCFTAAAPDAVLAAVDRLGVFLEQTRSTSG